MINSTPQPEGVLSKFGTLTDAASLGQASRTSSSSETTLHLLFITEGCEHPSETALAMHPVISDTIQFTSR